MQRNVGKPVSFCFPSFTKAEEGRKEGGDYPVLILPPEALPSHQMAGRFTYKTHNLSLLLVSDSFSL